MSEHRTYSIDFLLKRVARARADGDVERARPEWNACVVRGTVRVTAAVRAFVAPDGTKIAPHDRAAVVNDALERASRRMIHSLETLTEPVFLAAMYTCGEHACRDHIRKEGARQKHVAGSFDDPDSGLERDAELVPSEDEDALEAAERLDAALARMTNERHRRAVQLKRLGHKTEEIATELGVSKDNAYQLVSRGLRELRRLMEP